MSELPESWIKTSLGQVVNYAENETVDPADMPSTAWLLELEDIERDSGNVLERKTVGEREPKSSKNRFHAGDVLYGKLRPYLNKVVRADQDGFCSSEIIAIPPGVLDQNYLFYSMRSPEFIDYVSSVSHGMRMPRLGTQQAKSAPFVLPPLAEQTRISQKLDELLAQVDTLKARIDAIPALLKRFRQSVLAASVSGRLTEEWRKGNPISSQWSDKTIKASVEAERSMHGFKPAKVNETLCVDRIEAPSNWVWLKFSEVSLKITDGAHNTPKITDEGFPYITAKDLTGGALDFSEGKFIAENEHRELYKKCSPSIGDLLVVNIGAGTGNSVLVDVDFEFSFKNIAIIKRPQVINPQYLKAFFDARKKAIFNEQTQGGAQPFLSLTMLGNIEIVLPPPVEQTEIVRRIEQLFAFADQLEAKVATAQARIDHLTQSILAKAFRGELVPQDPNDEPASLLLERIQAQRAAAPKAKRGRKASA